MVLKRSVWMPKGVNKLVNFMCQLNWTKECIHRITLFLCVSVSMFLEDIKI
jgi:hypothetical protein